MVNNFIMSPKNVVFEGVSIENLQYMLVNFFINLNQYPLKINHYFHPFDDFHQIHFHLMKLN
jgi:hypothetical protein